MLKSIHKVDYSKIKNGKIYKDLGPKHFDLTLFCLSVFSLIANATFLHHRLNKIKNFCVLKLNIWQIFNLIHLWDSLTEGYLKI